MGNHVHKCLKVHTYIHIFKLSICSFIIKIKRTHTNTTFTRTYKIFILQPENITTLCQSVVSIAARECPSLSGAARDLAAQFTATFTLFGACHRLYSGKILSEEDIIALG